jgi:hypothetical protein
MQKTKSKILTAILLTAITLALFPMAANASTGNIYINPASTTLPTSSPLNQHFAAGGVVNLYFGGVSFSGGQFVLYLSRNGFSDIITRNSQPDISYSPAFDVVNLTDSAPHVYTMTGGYTWTIGSNWVNGTIARDIAGGSYFIKAFDGSQTSVAVTDTSLIVDPAVSITPTSGNAGRSITFSGSAFSAGAYLNFSYNIGSAAPVWFQNLTQTGSIGNFSVTIAAPDAMQTLASGNQTIANTTINFAAAINGTTTIVETAVDYSEFARGLMQIKQGSGAGSSEQLAATGQLFGNLTSFEIAGSLPVTGVGVTKTLRLAGNNFYAGNATLRWDNGASLGVTLVNATGFFNTTITVPMAGNGVHNITITDANNVAFTIFVTVVPSLTVSPTSGPVGTRVTATGYGFPAPTTGNTVNATIAFNGITSPWAATAMVDATGSFAVNFTVPQSPGGANIIWGYANATGSFVNYANSSFTVTASFTVTPSTFANNGSLVVVASGNGFTPGYNYVPNIDNNMLGVNGFNTIYQSNAFANETGYLSISFMGAGFQPGIHTISLYANGTTAPAAFASFTVTGKTADDVITMLNSMNATLISISGNVATLQTSMGTVSTSVSSLGSTLGASISNVQSGIATIQSNIGTITAKLTSLDAVLGVVAGDTATIKTSLGTITTTLDAINLKVVSIDNGVATINTAIGTLQGTVTSINGNVATIQTGVGTLQTSVADLKPEVTAAKDNTGSLSMLLYVAIILALVAAIAAVASIVLMRKKIAS